MESTETNDSRPATTDYRQFAIKVEDPAQLYGRLQALQDSVAVFAAHPGAEVAGQWAAGIRDALTDSLPGWVDPEATPSREDLAAAAENLVSDQTKVMERLQARLDHAEAQLRTTGQAGWQAYGEGILEVVNELCPDWYDEYAPWDLPDDFIPSPDVRLEGSRPETVNPHNTLPATNHGMGL